MIQLEFNYSKDISIDGVRKKEFTTSNLKENIEEYFCTSTIKYITLPVTMLGEIYKTITEESGYILEFKKVYSDKLVFILTSHSKDKALGYDPIIAFPIYTYSRGKFGYIALTEFKKPGMIITELSKFDKGFNVTLSVAKSKPTRKRSKTVYLVQQFAGGTWDHRKQEYVFVDFEIVGVYGTKEKAEDACKDESYIITPLKMNNTFPTERVPSPDTYCPREKVNVEDFCDIVSKEIR